MLTNPTFRFNLNEPVELAISGETGLVVGRSEYSFSENSYMIRYKSADGRAVESWWSESALNSIQL